MRADRAAKQRKRYGGHGLGYLIEPTDGSLFWLGLIPESKSRMRESDTEVCVWLPKYSLKKDNGLDAAIFCRETACPPARAWWSPFRQECLRILPHRGSQSSWLHAPPGVDGLLPCSAVA